MKNLPIIFAGCDNDINRCYLILPEQLKRLADRREEHPAILIGVKNLEEKTCNDALNELVAYLRNASR